MGNGIAVTDGTVVKQGVFGLIPGFPNEGADLYNPKSITEYQVYTLKYDYMPDEDINGRLIV